MIWTFLLFIPGLIALCVVGAAISELFRPTSREFVALRERLILLGEWLSGHIVTWWLRLRGFIRPYRHKYEAANQADDTRQWAALAGSLERNATAAAAGDEAAMVATADMRVAINDEIERIRTKPKPTRDEYLRLQQLQQTMRLYGGQAEPAMAPAEVAYFAGGSQPDRGIAATALRWWHVPTMLALFVACVWLYGSDKRHLRQRDEAWGMLRTYEANIAEWRKNLLAERAAHKETRDRLTRQTIQSADAMRAQQRRFETQAARSAAQMRRERARNATLQSGDAVDWRAELERLRDAGNPDAAVVAATGAGGEPAAGAAAGGVPSGAEPNLGGPTSLQPPS